MGNCIARIFRRRTVRRHIVLILIGLDNAGKTQTVNNLCGEKDDKVLPTVGFKAVNLVHKDTPVTIYDLGGGPHFRQIWPQYYTEVHGVIFVIDSSDFSRLEECQAVLEEVLSHDKISGKPVLVLANKQDKSGALDDIDVVDKLNIEPLVNRYRCPTLVESYSANCFDSKSKKPKLDPGLKRGYHWLLNYIVRRYGDINLRVQTDIHADLERRKRLMNRPANRASQTFTAISDDIGTQTGFENPNFDIRKSESDREKDMESGLIMVRPISVKNNSIDTTITIESVEDSDHTSVKPKLSPLFGRASDSTSSEATRVELEPRTEFRKLSPVVRNSGITRIDFENRPQSSPTVAKRTQLVPLSTESSGARDGRVRRAPPRPTDCADLAHPHRELVLTDRDHSTRTAASEAALAGLQQAATLPAAPRPASASLLVRRQLELAGAGAGAGAQHKRRLSLRYMHRNKTSPERTSMVLFEPGKTPRRLDKGDYSHPAATN